MANRHSPCFHRILGGKADKKLTTIMLTYMLSAMEKVKWVGVGQLGEGVISEPLSPE